MFYIQDDKFNYQLGDRYSDFWLKTELSVKSNSLNTLQCAKHNRMEFLDLFYLNFLYCCKSGFDAL